MTASKTLTHDVNRRKKSTYVYVTLLVFTLNLQFAVVAITSTSNTTTPLRVNHQRFNITEFNNTLLETKETEDHTKDQPGQTDYWFYICLMVVFNSVWIHINVAYTLEQFEENASSLFALSVITFTHLLLMLMVFVISMFVPRLSSDSASLVLSVSCQIGFIVFVTMLFVFHVVYLSEVDSLKQNKVDQQKNCSVV